MGPNRAEGRLAEPQGDSASLAHARTGLAIHTAASAHRSALMDARNPLVLAAVTVTGRRVSDMPWSYNSDFARLTRQGDADRAARAAYTQRYVAQPAQWRANYATVQGQLAVAHGIDGYLYDAALIAIATPLVMAAGVIGFAGSVVATSAGAGFSFGALALGGAGSSVALAAPVSAYSQFSNGEASLGRFGGDVIIGGASGAAGGIGIGKGLQYGGGALMATGAGRAAAGIADDLVVRAWAFADEAYMRTVGTAQFVGSIRIGVDEALLNSHTLFSNPIPLRITHRNSLSYVGPTHVYKIIGPDGKVFKIGESALGRTAEGLSRRAQAQVNRLQNKTGLFFESQIMNGGRDFSGKAAARQHETALIERFRSVYPEETMGFRVLPGNRTNR